MDWITRERLGIIILVAGTAFLAFSVRVRRQYHGEPARVVDELKRQQPDLIEPTDTYISRPMFWAGLALVAIGSALQW
jgi:hypothetical protein